jgi:Flp pilus assembly protein TadG
MVNKASEKGQALILITLAAVGLFAFAALAIDGSMAFSDERHAQNAADTAALAGALKYARGGDTTAINTIAQERATANGYDNGDSNNVTIAITNVPSGECPGGTPGKDITVTINSFVNTTFSKVIGRDMIENAVIATSRSCGSLYGPMFNGNAIVSLAPSGTGFDAHGTPDWNITGGGIFVNSNSYSAATCGGSAGVHAPSVTAVGGTSFDCHSVDIEEVEQNTGQQLTYSNYSSLFPRQPLCNGIATQSGGEWHPQSGADGSRVAFSGDMDFEPGLYCVTNSPGSFHGEIEGTGVTFYVMSANFSMKFNGGGNMTASAPTSGEYKGVLMYLAPQVLNGVLLNTQAIDMRGNGSGDIVGTIIAPSADVTMFGNSGTSAINSQIIAYQVDSGGNADITVAYHANDNFKSSQPATLTLLR